jgi:hypothetical protein
MKRNLQSALAHSLLTIASLCLVLQARGDMNDSLTQVIAKLGYPQEVLNPAAGGDDEYRFTRGGLMISVTFDKEKVAALFYESVDAKVPLNESRALDLLEQNVSGKWTKKVSNDPAFIEWASSSHCEAKLQLDTGWLSISSLDANLTPPTPFKVGDAVDWSLRLGPSYKGSIVKIEPDGVTIISEDGGRKIDFDLLSHRDRVAFKYDSYLAGKYSSEQFEKALDQKYPMPKPGTAQDSVDVTDPVKTGKVLVKESSRSDRSVRFGWVVPVTNNSDHDMRGVVVTLSLRDKDDIQLDTFLSADNTIPKGATVKATADNIVEIPLWNRVDHYVVTYHE